MINARHNAIEESMVASVIASRFSAMLSPYPRVCTSPECR